ncbi:hypothetical protein HMN09_01189800 [Mycena chlorophos]|uniref:Uncharacterized protein n=1 Tax=Mycena chlorophos TaxID=658473 RepID=A0A8H6VU11_MYCCL|nr:hypothetical protein HMN09_01189800 [Mycena chlorophos]
MAERTYCYWCSARLSAACLGNYLPDDALYACAACLVNRPELVLPPLDRATTLAGLFTLQRGKVLLLPASELRFSRVETIWYPAELLEYNQHRIPSQIAAKWLGREICSGSPSDEVFYRADGFFPQYPVHIDLAQLTPISLPTTLNPSLEETLCPDLSMAMQLAVPGILELIRDTHSTHAIVAHYHSFESTPEVDHHDHDRQWLASLDFTPTPGMLATMDAALNCLGRT